LSPLLCPHYYCPHYFCPHIGMEACMSGWMSVTPLLEH
jgi:hypothetical protein